MNSNQQKIFDAIHSNPIPKNIAWRDIEKLLVSLGAEIQKGKGSMVGFILNDIYAVFHRPHPRKVVYPQMIKRVRTFIQKADIKR